MTSSVDDGPPSPLLPHPSHCLIYSAGGGGGAALHCDGYVILVFLHFVIALRLSNAIGI